MCLANINLKKTEVSILISDKLDFRAKKMTRQKAVHCKMTNVNPPRRHGNPQLYRPNNRAAKCIKQNLTKK